jgi:hypothetical protein
MKRGSRGGRKEEKGREFERERMRVRQRRKL